jgi:hypothetical protein
MSLSQNQSSKFLLLLAASALLVLLISALFLLHLNKGEKTMVVTRNNVVNFKVMEGWNLYKINSNYDMDLGYFQNGDKSPLLCNINAITAGLERSPSFNHFLSTSLAGKMLTENHVETKIAGQNAWRGSYVFPDKNLKDPVQNDRVLFKWKNVYVDITLSYSQVLNPSIQELCHNSFEDLLQNLTLK